MNKKKINIILIIIVTILWSTLIYKYVIGLKFNENLSKINNKNFPNIKVNIEKDSFNLVNLNRDPFLNIKLKTEKINTKTIRNNKIIIKTPITTKNTITNFPIINYYGFIKSYDKKEDLMLIKVNGKLLKAKIFKDYNGLVIKKKFKDSLEVTFNNEVKVIHKNK